MTYEFIKSSFRKVVPESKPHTAIIILLPVLDSPNIHLNPNKDVNCPKIIDQYSYSYNPCFPDSFLPPLSLLVMTSLLVRFPTPSRTPPLANCPVTPWLTPSWIAFTLESPVSFVLSSWSAGVMLERVESISKKVVEGRKG